MSNPDVAKALRPRQPKNKDTQFFWDGIAEGKLLIQRCSDCGKLRHPPAPVCSSCHSFSWDTVESSGRASIVSHVKMHHPALPAFDNPNPIALVQLEEGTRLVASMQGFELSAIKIGLPVQVDIVRFDEELSLPVVKPRSEITVAKQQ